MNLFDKTFWRMLLGFILILVAGLASVYLVGQIGASSQEAAVLETN